MRITVTLLLVLLVVPAQALAQDERRLRGARGQYVAVIDGTSREWQGRLIEVAKDAVAIETNAGTQWFALADVKRVDAHGDKVWDGAVKGAILGGVLALIAGVREVVPQSVVGYGLVGLGLDAFNNCTHTVYRGAAARQPAPPVASASVRISW